LPVLVWQAYYLAYPSRNSLIFREKVALIDLNQWLELEIWGGLRLWHVFLFFMVTTTALFVSQEMVPALLHRLFPREQPQPLERGQFPKLDYALDRIAQGIPHPLPQIFFVKGESPTAYTTGLLNHALVLSISLVKRLDGEELEGVLAHEMAHLIRRDNWAGWGLLLLRALMFYNPVALFIFRRITQENEKICDDLSVSFTGKPAALATGLIKVFRTGRSRPRPGRGWRRKLTSIVEALDRRAQRAAIEERAERLLHPPRGKGIKHENLSLGFTVLVLVALFFFVV
jgi:Zn-dependent protease with chaperone function